jgi:hypothetical protein
MTDDLRALTDAAVAVDRVSDRLAGVLVLTQGDEATMLENPSAVP